MTTMIFAVALAAAAHSAEPPADSCAGWNNYASWGSADIYKGSALPDAQERLAPLIWLVLADEKHERPGLDKSAWELYLSAEEKCGFLKKYEAAVPRHRDMVKKLLADTDAALAADQLDLARVKVLGQYLVNEMSWLGHNGRDVTFLNNEAVRGKGPWIVTGAEERYNKVLDSYKRLKARLQAKPKKPVAVKPPAPAARTEKLDYKDRPKPAGTDRDPKTGQDYYK